MNFLRNLSYWHYVEFLLLYPAIVALLLFVTPTFPGLVHRISYLLFVFVVWRVSSALEWGIASKFSDHQLLREYVESRLWSASWWKQKQALRVLGVVLGYRFGEAFAGPRMENIVRHWREWWSRNSSQLTWDNQLRVYLLPEPSSPTTTN